MLNKFCVLNKKQFAVLLIYLPNCLSQETAKGPLRSSSETATCYYQSNHSKVEAIPLSALPKDTIRANLPAYLHAIPLMLNVKQGSCEYQHFKYFGLTRPGIERRSTAYACQKSSCIFSQEFRVRFPQK